VNDTVVGALLVYCFALISVGCVQTPILQCVMADHVCALMLYDCVCNKYGRVCNKKLYYFLSVLNNFKCNKCN